jgi:esterase
MELHYKTLGAGEPVVILHGLFGTSDNWQTIGRQLAEHFSVYLLDLRNHGRSPHSDGAFDYPLLAQDVWAFMQANWLYRARVIGHSMGGKVAMQLALQQPDAVEKLVVIDIAPKTYRGGHEAIFEAIFALDLATLDDRKTAEQFLMQRLDNDTGTVQFLLKNLTRLPSTQGDGFVWKMNVQNLYEHYQDILNHIDTENSLRYEGDTLFVRGDRSKYIQDSDWDNIQAIFPTATLQTVQHSGHWVHAEQPAQLLKILMDFL